MAALTPITARQAAPVAPELKAAPNATAAVPAPLTRVLVTQLRLLIKFTIGCVAWSGSMVHVVLDTMRRALDGKSRADLIIVLVHYSLTGCTIIALSSI